MAETAHSHKIAQLESGLGEGCREGVHSHWAPQAVITVELLRSSLPGYPGKDEGGRLSKEHLSPARQRTAESAGTTPLEKLYGTPPWLAGRKDRLPNLDNDS